MAADFGEQIKAWTAGVDNRINLFVQKVALEMYSRITKRTPVDTGLARTNWIPALNAPVLTATTSTNFGAMEADAFSLFAEFDYKNCKSLYITNSVPYIERLEHGWSKQAPQGMVRVTVAEFQNVIQAQII